MKGATITEVKCDQEEELSQQNIGGGEALLMNNGSRDTSHSDIQKLQQQLQDIKEQVCIKDHQSTPSFLFLTL